MRQLQRLADAVVNRLAPRVEADATWWTDTKCANACTTYPAYKAKYTRQCWDSTGACTSWTNTGNCCSS
ncbi:hypothetical protein [Streptomyces sp. NBC_00203]|uniref:hypothetical protein n=1 Tax=Streptomyces sp. NBC_00203 TaxID=2975680 RepID=UPI0032553C5B